MLGGSKVQQRIPAVSLSAPMMLLAADAVGVTHLLLLFLSCWSICLVDLHEVEMGNTIIEVAAA